MEKFTDHYIAKANIWQIYEIITNIEQYPLFVPWCLDVKIISQQEDWDHKTIIADTTVGFEPFKLKYRSEIRLHPPQDGKAIIQITSNDKIFRHLYTEWNLTEYHQTSREFSKGIVDQGTKVVFSIDFEFASPIHRTLITKVFRSACCQMIEAFQQREQEILAKARG